MNTKWVDVGLVVVRGCMSQLDATKTSGREKQKEEEEWIDEKRKKLGKSLEKNKPCKLEKCERKQDRKWMELYTYEAGDRPNLTIGACDDRVSPLS